MHGNRSVHTLDELLAATLDSRDAFTRAASLFGSLDESALCLERARDYDRVADFLMVYALNDPRAAVLEAVLESRRAYRLALSLAQQLLGLSALARPVQAQTT